MEKIITIHIGGTGIRLGDLFYKRLLKSHVASPKYPYDIPDRFCKQETYGDYDFEPLAINVNAGVTKDRSHFIDPNNPPPSRAICPEDSFLIREGSTYGSYARGYALAKTVADSVKAKVDGIINGSSSEGTAGIPVEGFVVIMGAAGGTGSGMGARILEMLKQQYPQKKAVCVAVFDGGTESSTPLYSDYNQLLLTHSLAQHSDATIVLDNQVLSQLATTVFEDATPNWEKRNLIMERIVFRLLGLFLTGQNMTLSDFVATFVRTPGMPFLIPFFNPITRFDSLPSYGTKISNLIDQAYTLADPMVDIGRAIDPLTDTFFHLCQNTSVVASEKNANTKFNRARDNHYVNTLTSSAQGTGIPMFDLEAVHPDPKLTHDLHTYIWQSPDDAMLLVNSPSVFLEFLHNRILNPFDRLHARGAFVHHFEQEGITSSEFAQARADLGFLAQDYLAEIQTVNQLIIDQREAEEEED